MKRLFVNLVRLLKGILYTTNVLKYYVFSIRKPNRDPIELWLEV